MHEVSIDMLSLMSELLHGMRESLHGTINANIMCLTFSTVWSGEVLDNEYRIL